MSPVENYYTEEEIAEFLGIKKCTLQNRRSLGKGHPPYVKVGSRVLYPKKEFNEWLKKYRLQREIA